MPGMATSRIRQSVRSTTPDARYSSADENARASKPSCTSKSGSDSRTDSSSSTTDTSGREAVKDPPWRPQPPPPTSRRRVRSSYRFLRGGAQLPSIMGRLMRHSSIILWCPVRTCWAPVCQGGRVRASSDQPLAGPYSCSGRRRAAGIIQPAVETVALFAGPRAASGPVTTCHGGRHEQHADEP